MKAIRNILINVLFVLFLVSFTISCGSAFLEDPVDAEENFSLEADAILAPRLFGTPDRTELREDLRATRRKAYAERVFAFMSEERAVPAAAFIPSDATFIVTGAPGDIPFAGTYDGRKAIRSYFKSLFDAVDIRDLIVEYQLAEAEYLSSHIRITADVVATGKRIELGFCWVWRFGVDGRPEEIRVYYDTALFARAFIAGGDSVLEDRVNPDDDFVIGDTPVDEKQLVSAVYDNFYAGDIPAVIALLSENPAVYFQGEQTDFPFSGIYRGVSEILQFVYNLAGTAVPYDIDLFLIHEGDRVDVVLFENWTVFATGKNFNVHTVNSWKVDQTGKAMGFINYPDTDNIARAYRPD